MISRDAAVSTVAAMPSASMPLISAAPRPDGPNAAASAIGANEPISGGPVARTRRGASARASKDSSPPSLLAAWLALAPLPAAAHGAALGAAIGALAMYLGLLVLAPLVSAKGDRLRAFLAVLIGYPAVLFAVPMVTYQMYFSSQDADKAWAAVMQAVGLCACAALVGLRAWREWRKRAAS